MWGLKFVILYSISPLESTESITCSSVPLLAQESCGKDVNSLSTLILPLKGSNFGSDLWLSHHCTNEK